MMVGGRNGTRELTKWKKRVETGLIRWGGATCLFRAVGPTFPLFLFANALD